MHNPVMVTQINGSFLSLALARVFEVKFFLVEKKCDFKFCCKKHSDLLCIHWHIEILIFGDEITWFLFSNPPPGHF